MPTKHKRETVLFTQEEADKLHSEVRARNASKPDDEYVLTFSNLIREKLRFPHLQRGATKGNKRAVGNRSRWHKDPEK